MLALNIYRLLQIQVFALKQSKPAGVGIASNTYSVFLFRIGRKEQETNYIKFNFLHISYDIILK